MLSMPPKAHYFRIELQRIRSTLRKIYRGFPSKLHHGVPPWVEPGNLFHIRISLERAKEQSPLTTPRVATLLLESAQFYELKQRWHITVFLVMPDHVHTIASFPAQESMSSVIGDWKRLHMQERGIDWQEGYFDHRLRNDERGEQLSAKVRYIRNNPVAAGLCEHAEDWPWVYPRD